MCVTKAYDISIDTLWMLFYRQLQICIKKTFHWNDDSRNAKSVYLTVERS